ncbi:uncharacterized protein [Equus przewalskii]|uniref:Uncharacterized protein n=1 Tax=Equus przewalskii TaxID=9798 RepID=A0ABM4KA15_EQUPR
MLRGPRAKRHRLWVSCPEGGGTLAGGTNGGSANLYPGVAPARSPRGHEHERARARARPRPCPLAPAGGAGLPRARACRSPSTLGRRPAGLGVPLSLAGGRGGVPESPPPRQEARLELGSGRDACRPLRSSGSNPSSARATPRRWTSCLGASVSPLGVSRASPGSCLEMQLLRSPRTCRIRPAGGAQQSGREQVPGVMLLRGKGWAPLLRAIDSEED